MAYSRKTSAKVNTLAEFIKKYWPWILGAIAVVPWAIKYLRQMSWDLGTQTAEHQKDVAFEENADPAKLANKFNNVLSRYGLSVSSTKGQLLSTITKKIVEASGANYWDAGHWYSWLDPRGWTENDKDIYNALLELMQNERYSNVDDGYNIITELYFQYTRSRNLSADLLKWLDKGQLDGLRKTQYFLNYL